NHVPSCQPFDDLEGEVTSSSLTWPLPQAATLRYSPLRKSECTSLLTLEAPFPMEIALFLLA
ncbi:hypothetical protein Tco_1434381, partial [Tanacetum coccineum]